MRGGLFHFDNCTFVWNIASPSRFETFLLIQPKKVSMFLRIDKLQVELPEEMFEIAEKLYKKSR